VVPFIGGKYARTVPLAETAIAVSLFDVVSTATGKLRQPDRARLADRFGVPEATAIVVSGVAKDDRVEAWWSLPNREEVLSQLHDVGVRLLTVPNFSLFIDVPRYDNLHAMKRIALVWAESLAAGLPAALHTNGRTERDYERWSEFIRERAEVTTIAFEFATGCGYGRRIDWHVHQLCNLVERVGRPLALVVRGGTRKLDVLRRSFARVILIETEAYMRAVHRRQAYITFGRRLRWVKRPTKRRTPIDTLLVQNIRTVRAAFEAAGTARDLGACNSPAGRAAEGGDRQTLKARALGKLNAAAKAQHATANGKNMVPAAKSHITAAAG
jgi:hypothetical protein